MPKLLMNLNENGFTFLESLFHLLIAAIFLQFVVLFFYWKAPIERQLEDYFATEWELFAIDLQMLLLEVEDFSVAAGNQTISFINKRGKIQVGQSGTLIRKTTYDRGYIPLFTNVYSTTFIVEGHELLLKVTMLDGSQRERWFAIGSHPK
ncbi:competence type IV pilus minor pilin ComGF [Sporosarcina highlanderae]|uniref:Competence type IV pilus minor pilin ComGF n=1 Tax=Sporosarcina highlanderae TaxID=3035916 RepID=A0ABT8JV20_9BACL|nr:competence type IV pilus minor pilin ComGF [Sporosarcina highlanderae]MDN4609024.1 competence type IV pilus minor pilin ComGF [Sporosarcina highlanderae]